MCMVQRKFACARIPNPPLTQSSPDARTATEGGRGGGGGADSHRLTERKRGRGIKNENVLAEFCGD